jgi:hypothetical protein
MKRMFFAAGALALVVLTGCGAGSALSQLTTQVTTQTPIQVTTYGEALTAAKGVTDLTDVAVNTGKLTRSQLTTLNGLNERLHTALTDLGTAQAKGQSLVFAAFNEALAQWAGNYAQLTGAH